MCMVVWFGLFQNTIFEIIVSLMVPRLKCLYIVCGITGICSVFLFILTTDAVNVTEKWKTFLSDIGFISDFKSRVMNETTTQTMTKHCTIYSVTECLLNQDIMKQHTQMV